MKCRLGYISNSSSASFIVNKNHLNEEQIDAIKHHIEYAIAHNIVCDKCNSSNHSPSDAWTIRETDTEIIGETSMDNFYMWKFLEAIGINLKDVDIDAENYFEELRDRRY